MRQRVGLDDRPRELFHKQRHAVGPLGDLIDHLLRDVPADLRRHHLADLTLRQPVQRDLREMRQALPRRDKFRPERQQDQNAVVQSLRNDLLDELQRRGVEPVQVFQDEQHRLLGGLLAQPVPQQLEGLFLLELRIDVERRKAAFQRD